METRRDREMNVPDEQRVTLGRAFALLAGACVLTIVLVFAMLFGLRLLFRLWH